MASLLSYITPIKLSVKPNAHGEHQYEIKKQHKEDKETEEIKEDTRSITIEDLLKMENNINTAINTLSESMKNEVQSMKEELKAIPELKMKVEKLENENFELQGMVKSINADLLIKDEERDKDKEKYEQFKNKIEKKFVRLYDTMGKMFTKEESAITDQQIGFVNKKLFEIEDKLNNNPVVQVIEKDIPATFIERIESIEKVMKGKVEYKVSANARGHVIKKDGKDGKDGRGLNVVVNKAADEDLIVNSDILLITTSNGKRINTDILDHKSKSQNFTCYTYSEVKIFCDKVKITKQPEKILLHCGNNDLQKDVNIDLLKDELKAVLQTLRKVFPNSQIVLSTLFPRGEDGLEKHIAAMNLYMNELIKKITNTIIMNNNSITRRMIHKFDKKHLTKEGFFTFLANIRFALYGQLPKPMRSQYKRLSFAKNHH